MYLRWLWPKKQLLGTCAALNAFSFKNTENKWKYWSKYLISVDLQKKKKKKKHLKEGLHKDNAEVSEMRMKCNKKIIK